MKEERQGDVNLVDCVLFVAVERTAAILERGTTSSN